MPPLPVRRTLGALTLLLAGCAGEPADAIVGRWALQDQPYALGIEFLPDGRYRALTPTGVLNGHWETMDGDRLATWASDRDPRRVSRYRIDDGILTIHHDDGRVLRHARAP